MTTRPAIENELHLKLKRLEPSRDPFCPHFRLEKDPRNPKEYVCVDCYAWVYIDSFSFRRPKE